MTMAAAPRAARTEPATSEGLSPDALPLTKACDPAVDFPRLEGVLGRVDQHEGAASTQHPMRRWEYGLALYAWATWQRARTPLAAPDPPYQVLDVGGGGSPFHWMLEQPHTVVEVIDPVINCGIESALIAPNSQDAVFCLSTLEHVEQPTTVLKAMVRALRPHGLLFLTFDYTDAEGPDEYQFAWMRRRIYTPATWQKLYKLGRELGLQRFGGCDWAPRGAQVFDYNFASLCMTKRDLVLPASPTPAPAKGTPA